MVESYLWALSWTNSILSYRKQNFQWSIMLSYHFHSFQINWTELKDKCPWDINGPLANQESSHIFWNAQFCHWRNPATDLPHDDQQNPYPHNLCSLTCYMFSHLRLRVSVFSSSMDSRLKYYRHACSAHLIFFDLISLIIHGETRTTCRSSFRSILQHPFTSSLLGLFYSIRIIENVWYNS